MHPKCIIINNCIIIDLVLEYVSTYFHMFQRLEFESDPVLFPDHFSPSFHVSPLNIKLN